jgi:surfeit locus 1 family protein
MRLKHPAWVLLVAAVLAAAGTARLGVWQLDRAATKVRLQTELMAQRALPALAAGALPADAAGARAQRQRAVVLSGRWIPEHTVYLDNRPMIGRTGFYAVTPLRLDDGSAVLVQRGWLPRDQADRTRIAAPPMPTGPVVVHGRIVPALARLYELGEAGQGAIRQNLAIDSFTRETALPLRTWAVVQEDGPKPPQDGLLRQWPEPAADVQKHYGYAFQWFALCALILGLYVWFQIVRPRRTGRAHAA